MNRLKELRKEKGLTQQELANEIGTSKLTISNWENEKHIIKSDKAQQLADHFGVSVRYLLGYPSIPYETYTPREVVAWEEFQDFFVTDTKLTFENYLALKKSRINDDYLELIINFSNSSPQGQKLILEILKNTAKLRWFEDKYTDD